MLIKCLDESDISFKNKSFITQICWLRLMLNLAVCSFGAVNILNGNVSGFDYSYVSGIFSKPLQ